MFGHGSGENDGAVVIAQSMAVAGESQTRRPERSLVQFGETVKAGDNRARRDQGFRFGETHGWRLARTAAAALAQGFDEFAIGQIRPSAGGNMRRQRGFAPRGRHGGAPIRRISAPGALQQNARMIVGYPVTPGVKQYVVEQHGPLSASPFRTIMLYAGQNPACGCAHRRAISSAVRRQDATTRSTPQA